MIVSNNPADPRGILKESANYLEDLEWLPKITKEQTTTCMAQAGRKPSQGLRMQMRQVREKQLFPEEKGSISSGFGFAREGASWNAVSLLCCSLDIVTSLSFIGGTNRKLSYQFPLGGACEWSLILRTPLQIWGDLLKIQVKKFKRASAVHGA